MGKIESFLIEFNNWFWTYEGTLARDLVSAWFVFIFYIFLVISDFIYSYVSGNYDFILVAVLFIYLAYLKLKSVKLVTKEWRKYRNEISN